MKKSQFAFLQFVVLCIVSTVSAQPKGSLSIENVKTDSITGVVYDAITKRPLEGVRINSLDKKASAISNESGKFGIKLSVFQNILVFSADDYSTKQVPVFAGEKMKMVFMNTTSKNNYFSNEVNYQGSTSRLFTPNSQKTIDIDNFSSFSPDVDIQNQLGADVKITRHSGVVSSGASMLIQGINSLNANSQPLIVVDGVIYDEQKDISSIFLGNVISPLSNIDVNDIQSITVVKDGTSYYGSKGANGVLLITTNRGRGMATKIIANATFDYQTSPKIIPVMNAYQYRVYLTDLLSNKDAQLQLSDQYFINDNPKFVYYNRYHNDTKWSDLVYRGGLTHGYNVAVNGGDDIALYNLSVGFASGQGNLESTNYNRLNARFNSDINISKELKVAIDISYLQSSRLLRNDGAPEQYNSVVNSLGFLSLVKSPFLNPYLYSNEGKLTNKLEDYDFLGVSNPLALIEYGNGKTQQNNFNMSLKPVFSFNDKLKLATHLSYSMNNISENLYSPKYGGAVFRDYENGIISYNHAKSQFDKQAYIFDETQLTWKNTYGHHFVDANVGFRYYSNTLNSIYTEGHNSAGDSYPEIYSSSEYKNVVEFDSPYKMFGYFGLINYSFKNRYLLQGSVATETNSVFGINANSGFNFMGQRWAVFPGLNAAWIVSSENFMKSLSFVDVLKLRVGIGLSGNDGIQSTAAQSYLDAVRYGTTGVGLSIYNIANDKVQWETVTKRTLGLDLVLFNGRLNLTANLYSNVTNDLLVQKDLSDITGVDKYWTNDGKMRNVGYDLSINSTIIKQKDFELSLGASIGHYANKVLSLANGSYTTTVYGGEILTAVNQSIGQFYGYKSLGVFATTAEAQAANLKTLDQTGNYLDFKAGDVHFADISGPNGTPDGIIDEKDKQVIGNSNPDFYGNIFVGAHFKGFNLQCVFNYSYGNDVYNYLKSQLESGSTFFNQTIAMNNRWLTEGQVTNIPRSQYGDPMNNNRFSSRWIEDGSYIRLKTVELSYKMPFKIPYLEGLVVWVGANNLWTYTKYTGMDPEFSVNNKILYQGIDSGTLPQSITYCGGVKINL